MTRATCHSVIGKRRRTGLSGARTRGTFYLHPSRDSIIAALRASAVRPDSRHTMSSRQDAGWGKCWEWWGRLRRPRSLRRGMNLLRSSSLKKKGRKTYVQTLTALAHAIDGAAHAGRLAGILTHAYQPRCGNCTCSAHAYQRSGRSGSITLQILASITGS